MSRETGTGRSKTECAGPESECVRCGSCTVVCPVFRVTGRESVTARGRMHLMGTELAGQPSANYQDLFSQCLLCGACEDICPRNLPILALVIKARSHFPTFYGRHGIRKAAAWMALARPGLLEGLVQAGIGLNRLDILPKDSGLRLKLGLVDDRSKTERDNSNLSRWPDQRRPVPAVSYFAGCLARYLQPSVASATEHLFYALTGGRLDQAAGQVCCGLAAVSAGKEEEARRLAEKNISAFAGSTGPILTSCASCSSHLKTYPDLFTDDPAWHTRALAFSERVREFSSFFLEKAASHKFLSKAAARLFYHDPCHLRFTRDGREAPRKLIDLIGNIERLESEDGPRCCGQGGLFHLAYPDLSDQIFTTACRSALTTNPDIVVSTCSGCLMQWQVGLAARHSEIRVRHLAHFLVDCLAPD